MRVLFMGTPEIAASCLSALAASHHELVGVVTSPDKPKGRKYVMTPPPVKVTAESLSLPVYQPERLRDEALLPVLTELAPDVIVVVAYGKILPANVLNYPKHGCINVHGSLLPEYRGAAPMQRAIIDGKSETGITTMMMDVGLDTGDMLLREVVAIEPNDNFETIHDKLGACGADVLLRTIEQIENGALTRTPQDGALATYAAKIEKSDCILDFTRTAEQIHDQVRGLSPIPLAFTYTADGKMLKVVATEVVSTEETGAVAGTVTSVRDGRIVVACGKGSLALLSVLPEGKKRMSAADFINGRRIAVGDVLGAQKD